MSATPFTHRHRVSYAECTLGNHVYHARYLEVLEVARGEWFRWLGQPLLVWQTHGVVFPVVEVSLRHLRPARYDEVLITEVRVTQLSRLRLDLAYRVRNQDQKAVLEAATRHVCTGLDERPRRMPAELFASLGQAVESPPSLPEP